MIAPLPLPRSFILFVVFLLITGCRGKAPQQDESPSSAPVHAQTIGKVKMGEWTDLLGTTQPLPKRSAKITAVVEGRVLSVLPDRDGSEVVEGHDVKAGWIIVQLDDRVLRANDARLKAIRDELDEHKKQAEYALKLAKIDVKRFKDLIDTSGARVGLPPVSQIELEKAEVLHLDAQSKLLAAQARQAAALAELKAHEEQLEFFTLRAPIDGKLGIVQAVPGQTLSPGTVVAEVVDLRDIDVVCFAPPAAAARLKIGQIARLVNEAAAADDPDRQLMGKVVYIGVQAQAETGNIAVKVRFANPGLKLRGNAIVHVQVLTKDEQERDAIPDAALMEDLDFPTVIAIQDVTETEKHEKVGKVRKLRALVGVRDRNLGMAEVHLEDPANNKEVDPKGLWFVTAGGHGLQDGDLVRIEKDDPKETK